MTETEKLRALLAEARDELCRHVFTQESPACVNCGGESGFDVGRACPYAADRELKDRIDAALAEPVGGCDRCETLRGLADTAAAEQGLAQRRMMEAQKQRDEARAEVERLRKAVHTRACQLQSAYNVGCVCGADEHQRDLQKLAYQRGAEAMREAAAVRIDAEAINGCTGPFFGNIVRALPLPKDKP